VLKARDKFNAILEGTAISCVIGPTITARDFDVTFVALLHCDYGGLDVLYHALVDICVDANPWGHSTFCTHHIFESKGYASNDSLALCGMKCDNIAAFLK